MKRKIEEGGKKLKFKVQGSSADPYTVVFVNRGGGNLSAYCDCKAGENGLHCRHRLDLMRGDKRYLVAGASLVEELLTWIPGSDIEAALENISKKERDVVLAKAAVSQAKKELARKMLD